MPLSTQPQHKSTFSPDPLDSQSTLWLDEIDPVPSRLDDSSWPQPSTSPLPLSPLSFWPSRVGLMVNRDDGSHASSSSSTSPSSYSSPSALPPLSRTSPSISSNADASSSSEPYPFADIHVRPHGAHSHSPATGPEEHEYEALPLGAGWGVNMAAGAMAGISEHSVIFPIDSIKTRMQILPSLSSSLLATVSPSTKLSPAAASSSPPRPPLPHRPVHTVPQMATLTQHLRSVSTTDGLRSLWRGVASVIMGAGPAHAAHFGMYEFVREVSGGRGEGWWGVGGTALAAAAATVSSDALMNPFDVVKQRMQIQNSPYRSVISCAKSVYTTEGLAAFYVSYPTTLTMSVPFTAVQFSVYESLKGMINPDGSYSPGTHVVAGGVAGAVAAAVTTPLDVAKTLLQTRGSSSDLQIRQVRGMTEALRLIRERDGWKGLRRGLIPRVLTVTPSTAISWMSYEFFKVLIRQKGHLPEKGQPM